MELILCLWRWLEQLASWWIRQVLPEVDQIQAAYEWIGAA